MDTNVAYGLMIATLGIFGYIAYQATNDEEIGADEYLSARGSQDWLRIGLSLFASGMGVWVLLTPSEVAYYGGFWESWVMRHRRQPPSYSWHTWGP